MKPFTRMLFIITCLLAALGCYFIGIPIGGIVFLALGVVFELLFWIGVLGRKKPTPSAQ